MSRTDYLVYIGRFNGPHSPRDKDVPWMLDDGIGIHRLDTETGKLEFIEACPGLLGPSFIAFHPTLPMLYALERQFQEDTPYIAGVSSYSIDDKDSGHLEKTARVDSAGIPAVYISVHPSGRHAYVAQGANVVAFPLAENGDVGPADKVIVHEGSGPDPRHQKEAHPHSVRPSANGKFLLVADRGTDYVHAYELGPNGELSENGTKVQCPPATGPRHMAFHPSGKYMFTIGEINSTLNVLSYDEDKGPTGVVSVTSTLPADFNEESMPAEVICHPNGRFVYVSNRGHNSIATLAFDESDGSAKLLGTVSVFGDRPRNFNIDPSAKFLIVANTHERTPDHHAGNLVMYRVNQDTFLPEPTGQIVNSVKPSCVIFRPIAS